MDSSTSFRALRVLEKDNGFFVNEIQTLTLADLPEGAVLIRVGWSSLNFKDSLSANGHKGVTRTFPHTPGIDAAGTVVHSEVAEFRAGDEVIVTGFDLGMNTAGGFGEYIRVPASWVVPKPPHHDLSYFMALGTAGLTAGLSVDRLATVVSPGDGDILVTGATGGVGCLAVALLARLGYSVVAITSKVDHHDFLTGLGARRVVDRALFKDLPARPLLKSEWAGIIDTVGGSLLSTLLKTVNPNGAVSTCGMVAGTEINTSIFPFILRGVTLFGIDSAEFPRERKQRIWEVFDGEWALNLDDLVSTVSLDELPAAIDKIHSGKMLGRTVLKHTQN